jgi:hypothetical protein
MKLRRGLILLPIVDVGTGCIPADNLSAFVHLGFIGIDEVRTVRAEGMNIPQLAIHAVSNGEKAVAALVI